MLERIGLTRLINQYLAKRLQLTATYKIACLARWPDGATREVWRNVRHLLLQRGNLCEQVFN